MKITDTLHRLLRAPPPAEEDSARPAPSEAAIAEDAEVVTQPVVVGEREDEPRSDVEDHVETAGGDAPPTELASPEGVLVPQRVTEQVAGVQAVEPEGATAPAGLELSQLESVARVAESSNLGFHLGSAVERVAAAAGQGSAGVPALREAIWLIERYIGLLERRPIGADLHRSSARLARTGDALAGLKALAEALGTEAAPAGAVMPPELAEPAPRDEPVETTDDQPPAAEALGTEAGELGSAPERVGRDEAEAGLPPHGWIGRFSPDLPT